MSEYEHERSYALHVQSRPRRRSGADWMRESEWSYENALVLHTLKAAQDAEGRERPIRVNDLGEDHADLFPGTGPWRGLPLPGNGCYLAFAPRALKRKLDAFAEIGLVSRQGRTGYLLTEAGERTVKEIDRWIYRYDAQSKDQT